MEYLDSLLVVLKYVLYVVVAIPVIGFFLAQSINIRRRTQAELVNGNRLVLRFRSSDFDSSIKVVRVYSFRFSTIDVSPTFVLTDAEAVLELPCRCKSSTNHRNFWIALLTQKSSYWSLTMIKTKTISDRT